MSTSSIRVGVDVSLDGLEGKIVRVSDGGQHCDILFNDGSTATFVHYSRVKIALHNGVFASDESLESWEAGKADRDETMKALSDLARDAERKRLAGLAGKAFDIAKAAGVSDIPSEAKKIISDMKRYAPLAKLLPTGSSTLTQVLSFIEEAATLLALLFGVK